MGIVRPTGGFAQQMLDSGGWPDLDEDTFFDRAQMYTGVLRQATDVLEIWGQQRAQIFDGGVWTGGAALAAEGKLGAHVDQLVGLQHAIAAVVTWHSHIAGAVIAAKAAISDNVESAHTQINSVLSNTSMDADEQRAAIDAVVAAAHSANLGVVTATAEQIGMTRGWTPPKIALTELLDQKTPPPLSAPDDTSGSAPISEPPPGRSPATPPLPTPQLPTPHLPATPAPGAPPRHDAPQRGIPSAPVPGGDAPAETPTVRPTPTPIPVPIGGLPAMPGRSTVVPPTSAVPPSTTRPGRTDDLPHSPEDTETDSDTPDLETQVVADQESDVVVAPTTPDSPAAAQPAQPADAHNRGVTAASVLSATPAVVAPVRGEDSSPATAPAAATSTPGGSMTGGAAPGASAGPGARTAAPVQRTPAAASPRAASAPHKQVPSKHTARTVPAEPPPDPPDRTQTPAAAAVAVVPVSAARAEREAIASASTADAARRRGADPLLLARRIAAALNASDNPGGDDLGFFWVTAVTAAGDIVVANSYGLAYIPEGVLLPDPVQLATADHTIVPSERVRWSTYPVAAVQGWAAHHNTTVRAVIATAEQFARTDPGSAKVVLEPDDIPASGAMTGRSRLQVVDPERAQQLTRADDDLLFELLPPAPNDLAPRPSGDAGPQAPDSDKAAEIADAVAAATDLASLLDVLKALPAPPDSPQDRTSSLWFEVMKPMSTDAAGRDQAHIHAFHAYAVYVRDVAVHDFHRAADPTSRRAAAEEWSYWQCLTELLNSALGQAH